MLSPAFEAYLDIETTGLYSSHDEITVVGIYLTNGNDALFAQLVGKEITGDGLKSALQGTKTIYTYNGSRFDLPFINYRMGIDLANLYQHCDLMYFCWQWNLFGGLKSVERQLGIERHLKGIDGYQAVKLWWKYVNDYDEAALKTLLEYNREDVLNLKVLKEKLLPSH